MATYNTVIKKRNATSNSWDNVLPITTGENVLVSAEQSLSTFISETRNNYNVKEFGAVGDGVADDSTSINNCIAFVNSKGGGAVVISEGVYAVGSTIKLLSNVTLIMDKHTVLKAITNIDVVRVYPNSVISGNGATIDTSSVSTFSGSAIYLNGSDQFGLVEDAIGTQIDNLVFNGNYKGTAINLFCDVTTDKPHMIQFVRITNFDIFKYNVGIQLRCNPHSNPTSASWINGNIFDRFSISGCIKFIYLNGDKIPYECAGNYFTNFQFQPYYYYSQLAIEVDSNLNVFDGFIWDWDTDKQIECIKVTGSNNTFNTNIASKMTQKIVNSGYNNMFKGIIDNEQKLYSPTAENNMFFVGDQDDFLINADKRFSVTSNIAPTSGAINNMFNRNGGYNCFWNSVAELVIEIDLTPDKIVSLQTVGISFLYGNIAKNIKIEGFYENEYRILESTTNNYSNNFFTMKYASPVNVSKIKITLSGSLGTGISVSRIYAQDTYNSGKAFVESSGSEVFGNIVFDSGHGVVMKDTVTGANYLLRVGNGELNIVEI